MKHFLPLISFVIIISFISCNYNNTNTSSNTNNDDTIKENNIVQVSQKIEYINLNDDKAQTLIKRGTIITGLTTSALGAALKKSINEGGVENALVFCNHEALKITDSLAKENGVIIKRVAKKNRNPENETNAIESEIYKRYIIEWLEKTPIKPKLVLGENGNPIYYKPIFLQDKCLVCHGTPGETIHENVAAKIAELYPNDKAVNFKKGHPRGMWSVTFPGITVEE